MRVISHGSGNRLDYLPPLLHAHFRIWDPATGECDAVLGGHGGTVGALCVIPCPRDRHNAGDRRRTAPNAEELIVSGSGDATVRVWSRASWAEVGEWTCLAVLEGHRCLVYLYGLSQRV